MIVIGIVLDDEGKVARVVSDHPAEVCVVLGGALDARHVLVHDDADPRLWRDGAELDIMLESATDAAALYGLCLPSEVEKRVAAGYPRQRSLS